MTEELFRDNEMPKDPACGMEVDSKKAKFNISWLLMQLPKVLICNIAIFCLIMMVLLGM